MRLGLYPGTFNPIHNGHLQTALETLENLSLDQISFIPTGNPPHKSDETLIEAKIRFGIVEKVTEPFENFNVSDFELSHTKKEGRFYTIDTVKHFHKERPDDTIFLIIGGDAFLDLINWRKAKEIIDYVNIVVNLRPGTNIEIISAFSHNFFGAFEDRETELEMDIGVSKVYQKEKYAIYVNMVRQLEISSSNIRYRMEQGEDISFLVPKEVSEALKYTKKANNNK